MRTYIIPLNYGAAGYALNGRLEKRKAVEGIVCAVIGLLICNLFLKSASLTVRISVYILIPGIFGIFGLMGIGGENLSTYLFRFFKWVRIRKKPYIFNPHGEAYSVTAAEVALETYGIMDMIADTLDRVRSTFASKPIEYVEGETFRFATDPLTASLKNAQESDEQEQEPEPQQERTEGAKIDGIDELEITLREMEGEDG